MEIVKARGVPGVQAARGHVIVIDVLRAFTTAAFAFSRGAERLLLVDTAEEGLALKERNPELVLIGEIGGKPIPGFDIGNSPEAVADVDLTGKTVVFRSSNGVHGVVNAANAERIVLGSLVVADATVRWLQHAGAQLVTICAMGSSSGKDGVEDDACQDLLAARLAGSDLPMAEVEARVRGSGGGQAAMDPERPWVTPGDLEHALELDRFDFAMVVEQEGDALVVTARTAEDLAYAGS